MRLMQLGPAGASLSAQLESKEARDVPGCGWGTRCWKVLSSESV